MNKKSFQMLLVCILSSCMDYREPFVVVVNESNRNLLIGMASDSSLTDEEIFNKKFSSYILFPKENIELSIPNSQIRKLDDI